MATKVIMPQLGESVVEGTVGSWMKQVGDTVEEYEALLEVESDKVDSEIPAPAAGTVLAIYVQEGETVTAGTLLAYIGEPGEDLPESPAGKPAEAAASAEAEAAAAPPAAASPAGNGQAQRAAQTESHAPR